MTTDTAKLLRLQSWLSPAFPIGAFSYSHALEWAVEEGTVRDRVTLVDWLDADLRQGAGRMDGVWFALSWRAVSETAPSPGRLRRPPSPSREPLWRTTSVRHGGEGLTERDERLSASTSTECPLPLRERAAAQPPGEGEPQAAEVADILAIAELAAAMRPTAEFALESGQQGIAFLGAVRKAWPDPRLDAYAAALKQAEITPILPVAAGLCCAVHAIPLTLALPLYLHAWAANLINAGLRLIPLGQTDGQIALAAMEPAIIETAAEALTADIAEIGSAAFMVDIASMRHETQYTRLFRS